MEDRRWLLLFFLLGALLLLQAAIWFTLTAILRELAMNTQTQTFIPGHAQPVTSVMGETQTVPEYLRDHIRTVIEAGGQANLDPNSLTRQPPKEEKE